MREYIVKEYDREDYEYFQESLTNEKTIELLKVIDRGYLGDYNYSGKEDDFERYCLHMAIYRAIEVLKGMCDNYDVE